MGLFNVFFKKQQVEEKIEEPIIKEVKVEEKPAPKEVKSPLYSNQTKINPTSIEDIYSIIIQMKEQRTPALINFSNLDTKTSQRFMDLLCGAVVALGGEASKIQKHVYYFTVNK